MPESRSANAEPHLQAATEAFAQALAALRQAHEHDPYAPVHEVLDRMVELIDLPGGFDALYQRVADVEAAQVFAGSDWDYPATLMPELAWRALRLGDHDTTRVEILSEVRLLAVALGDYQHPDLHPEHARRLLRQIMALNLDLAAGTLGEADRTRPDQLGKRVLALYQFLLERMGSQHLVAELAGEVRRILAQRPVRVDTAKHMVAQIALGMTQAGVEDEDGSATSLVNALFSPTPGCAGDPGVDAYARKLAQMDYPALTAEARAMGASMRESGMVSPYHPVLLHHLRNRHDDLLLTALGLSSTGCDALLCYPQLVYRLVDEAAHPETSQAVHGLAMMLERAILHVPGVAPALWRQVVSQPCAAVQERLRLAYGDSHPPRVFLLADVLAMLGQPLGVGQGNHPTCQSARALSMWSSADPRRLLELLNAVARDDDVSIHFEGEALFSADLPEGAVPLAAPDVDAVSLIMVPHLDRIYWEMGRRCAQRGGDPHQWVNPEFHGDGVYRGFCIAVDVATGQLQDLDGFIRTFHAAYHPFYNGDLPLVHPQPAGIASTDSMGRFLGWHAISIQRLALDAEGEMRVYFFNPNNDSAQDWGQGVITSVAGHGEWPGESSLPVAAFVARLYAFHHDPRALGDPGAVPADEVNEISCLVRKSWGAGR